MAKPPKASAGGEIHDRRLLLVLYNAPYEIQIGWDVRKFIADGLKKVSTFSGIRLGVFGVLDE